MFSIVNASSTEMAGVSTNIPAFYKSYQDLSFLASVLGAPLKYKRFEKACVTNDVINVGTWACLILVGHSEGAARGVYAMKNHTASSIETIVDGGLHIEFTNPTTYELGIKYTGANPDTISVTVMYVR